MKKIIYAILITGLLFGCAKDPGSQVLAKVGNKIITLKEFDDRLAKIPPAYQETLKNRKEDLLDDLILEELLYREAKRRRLASKKEVKELLKEAERSIIVAQLIKDEIDDKVTMTDEEVKEHYDNNKDEFVSPEMFRASHILLASLEEARKITTQVNSGGNFAELAKKHSVDLTNTRGGDVGFFTYGQMVPEFEAACAKLKVGEVTSAPVKTQYGYHIIKLTDKKKPKSLSFEEVKNRIRVSLSNQKKRDIFDSMTENLKSKHKIVKNVELLKEPEIEEEEIDPEEPVILE